MQTELKKSLAFVNNNKQLKPAAENPGKSGLEVLPDYCTCEKHYFYYYYLFIYLLNYIIRIRLLVYTCIFIHVFIYFG